MFYHSVDVAHTLLLYFIQPLLHIEKSGSVCKLMMAIFHKNTFKIYMKREVSVALELFQ